MAALWRRHLAGLGRQLLAEAAPGCGPSTSGRTELASWAAAAGRQRWFSAASQAAAAAGGASACATAAAAAATAGGRGPPTGLRKLRLMVHNYKQLSKMRLSLLVVATSAAGYAAGSGERIDWAGLGWTSLGTMLASSSANALNQVYEKVNDGLMKRTMNRPLPTGRVSRPHALAFAAVCGLGGVWLLADKVRQGGRGAGAGQAGCGQRAQRPRGWLRWRPRAAGTAQQGPAKPSSRLAPRRAPPAPACLPTRPADQSDHRGAGGSQHSAVCWGVHPTQADQRGEHLGGSHRGRRAAAHGLGGRHRRPGRGRRCAAVAHMAPVGQLVPPCCGGAAKAGCAAASPAAPAGCGAERPSSAGAA